jgi:hypothetical protein
VGSRMTISLSNVSKTRLYGPPFWQELQREYENSNILRSKNKKVKTSKQPRFLIGMAGNFGNLVISIPGKPQMEQSDWSKLSNSRTAVTFLY